MNRVPKSIFQFQTMVRIFFILPLVVAIWSAVPARPEAEENFRGRVVRVLSGDTLSVKSGTKTFQIRLYGLDAPEEGQPYGLQARQLVITLALDQDVRVLARGRDDWGRLLGELILPDSRSLNQTLLQEGLAWWFRDLAPDDKQSAELEEAARRGQRGLWIDPNPVPPWTWRLDHRSKTGPGTPP